MWRGFCYSCPYERTGRGNHDCHERRPHAGKAGARGRVHPHPPRYVDGADEVTPDLTLLLDGTVERLAERLAERGNRDRLDREGMAFHRRVRQGFLELAASEPDRIKVVEADRDVEAVWADIKACVTDFLMKRGRSHAVTDQQ